MKVFVVGIGMTKFEKPGRREDFDYPDMALEATQKALQDAGVGYERVERAVVGYCYGESTCGQRALYQLGLTGIPIMNVNNNCATGSSALYIAHEFIAGERADCVLALGFEKMERGSLGSKWDDRTNPIDKHMAAMLQHYGFESGPPTAQLFGNAGREHMKRFGSKPSHFAKIAEKNHRHSVNNPNSQFRDDYTLDQIEQSKCIHDPLTKLQCCPTSDGSAAVLLVSERMLIMNPSLRKNAVEVIGISLATDLPSAFSDDARKIVGYDMTKKTSEEVYLQAGIKPGDIDVVELHDCFSANELITYEALGLCPEGGAGEFIDKGDNTYGGRHVVNPSGGLISKGHPLGATGIAQCVELCLHLRNEAGPRQVPMAKLALQHNLGLGGACVVAAYRKADSSLSPPLLGGSSQAQFKCGVIFKEIEQSIGLPESADILKKVNASYKFKVTADSGSNQGIWFINAKPSDPYVKFVDDGKAECTISAKDSDLVDIMSGKVDSTRAFMSGKLKVSGNIALGMKLKEFQTKAAEALRNGLSPSEQAEPKTLPFKSDKIFEEMSIVLKEDPSVSKKVNGSFKFIIKGADGSKIWFVDAKLSPGSVQQGLNKKADCTINVEDKDFVDIIEGKLNPQTAFFNKKLKVSGNMMLATKLSAFQRPKSKL